jgi:hypothetical protein
MTRRMALATRVACDQEGDGDVYKSDCNEGDGRATATRAMVTAMATAKATTCPSLVPMVLTTHSQKGCPPCRPQTGQCARVQ